jgi:serine/threonine-protein kinase
VFAVGEQVGAYTIVRQIGAGGMGEVYEARHRHLDRSAAIKVLLPAYSSIEGVIERFFNEAKAASVIHHPGIVEILDCDIHPVTGRAFIVMELLEGEDLGKCLYRVGSFAGAVPAGAAIASQIASALSAAHAKGITHRDLKPDNVFLAHDASSSDGTTVKVLDFGVAKLIADGKGGVNSTRPGSLLGTPLYMAPEQCRSADRVDHRSDIYSLGCIMFELFTGRTPFTGKGEGELLLAHITEAAPDILSLVPELDPRLGALVQSMLAKDPAARPQAMSDIVGALEAFVHPESAQASPAAPASGEPSAPVPTPVAKEPSARAEVRIPSAPAEASGRTMVLPTAKATTTLSRSAAEIEPPVVPGERRRRRKGAIVATVAGLAIAAAAGFVLMGRHPTGADAEARAPQPAAPSNPTPTQTPAPAPTAPPPVAAPPPAPKTVTVKLDSVPSGAEVWFADETVPRGTTPLAIPLVAGSPATNVTLKAASYADTVVVIDGSRDADVSAELKKKPAREREHQHEHEKEKEGQPGHHKHDSSSGAAPVYKPVGD